MQVELLGHQYETLQSTEKYIALISGVGGGKTWTGVHWCLQQTYLHPDALGFIGATTYGQLRNSTLSAVFSELNRLEIPYTYNQSSGILQIFEKKFLCKSLDNYDALRGIEIGDMWLDEAAFLKADAWNVMIGRLRDKRGSLRTLLTTTPNGYNWVFSHFHPDGEKNTPEHRLIKAVSRDNTFLPDGYLDSITSQYGKDSKLAAQELMGEFVNVSTGQIYYSFEQDLNVTEVKYNPAYPIWIGMDFNPHKMAAVLGQVIGDKLYIFEEIFDTQHGSNTEKVCKKIISKYGSGHFVCPDSTGNKATSNSNRSDHAILKQYGFNLKGASNPYRVDRYEAVNLNLEKKNILIDNSCKSLIRDLEQVSYKEGTDKPDDSDSMLTHCSDAFGYLVYKTMNPFKVKPKPIRAF